MPKQNANPVKGTLRGFITIAQAAQILDVTPMTLRRWDESGRLKAYRHPINGYRLYKEAELQGLLKTVRGTRYKRAV